MATSPPRTLLWVLLALHGFLTFAGCGGSDDDDAGKSMASESTAAPTVEAWNEASGDLASASATEEEPPTVTSISGQLEFTTDASEADLIAESYAYPETSENVSMALATSIASGVDGVEAEDIIIQDVGAVAARRLAIRRMSETSEDASLAVDYMIVVEETHANTTSAADSISDTVELINTTALTGEMTKELRKVKGMERIKIKGVKKLAKPKVKNTCETGVDIALKGLKKSETKPGEKADDLICRGARQVTDVCDANLFAKIEQPVDPIDGTNMTIDLFKYLLDTRCSDCARMSASIERGGNEACSNFEKFKNKCTADDFKKFAEKDGILGQSRGDFVKGAEEQCSKPCANQFFDLVEKFDSSFFEKYPGRSCGKLDKFSAEGCEAHGYDMKRIKAMCGTCMPTYKEASLRFSEMMQMEREEKKEESKEEKTNGNATARRSLSSEDAGSSPPTEGKNDTEELASVEIALAEKIKSNKEHPQQGTDFGKDLAPPCAPGCSRTQKFEYRVDTACAMLDAFAKDCAAEDFDALEMREDCAEAGGDPEECPRLTQASALAQMEKKCSKCAKLVRTTKFAEKHDQAEACAAYEAMIDTCPESDFNAASFTTCDCEDCLDKEGKCPPGSKSPMTYGDYTQRMQLLCSTYNPDTGYGYGYGHA